ncbi:MAG: DEAD/DEAH box helicase [Candidatus Latescibacteria bacterium]|nr:DEAD/DEAH box helicase [Candidatus Latescibacterota bacterium]
MNRSHLPLIVQSDRTVLLAVDHPLYEEARDELARFAELEKSPEHIHTYRITPLSLWNAAAAGLNASAIVETLDRLSKYEIPQNIQRDIVEFIARYGQVRLTKPDDRLILESDDPALIAEIAGQRSVKPFLVGPVDEYRLHVGGRYRGHVKQALIKLGFPVEDLAGYVTGAPLDLVLLALTRSERPFRLREYQVTAANAFHVDGGPRGGSGVIVLPCGAGKTMVGMSVMATLRCQTLILTANTVALRQWRDELLDKTSLTSDQIGEYSGEQKVIRPVTLATYQILTYRKSKDEDFEHFGLFNREDWGLIIYDEVHLLPAPVFRITSEIQARRRLGLTATLIREDGREGDVFSLIGPKRYDMPWKTLERQGWIATAECREIRVNLPDELRMPYALAGSREKFRLASENPTKFAVVRALLARHPDDLILIIGQYLKQLKQLAREIDTPLITGSTPVQERLRLYAQFRAGEITRLVVSKVANFAIDLPDANVAIQISGTFGSRQEEAQRLGRILRPKRDGGPATFYSIITRNTLDQDYAVNRQLFLTEQGYEYTIHDATEVVKESVVGGR